MSLNTIPVSTRCDEIIARYSLLQHPFYQRWTDGTLPVSALKDYAGEYGSFIRSISRGWEAIGQFEHAREEDTHAQIWETTFADKLGASVGTPSVKEAADLAEVSEELFSDRVTALGALYAFEAQQPVVAKAKVQGLREHYAHLPESCSEYFELHSDGYDEAALLAKDMDLLSLHDQDRVFSACKRLCQALYDALTGIHAPYVEMA